MLKSKLSFVAAAMMLATAGLCQGAVLANWTFETSLPTTAGPFSPEVGAGSASGSHAGTTTYSNPAGNGSAHSFSSTGWAVGDYYQFSTSTTGFNGVSISIDQTGSGTGPRDFQLSYSTDGSTFTSFGGVYAVLLNGGSPNASWNSSTASSAYTRTYDLSAITALDNTATIYFRISDTSTTSVAGGTTASGGTDRVDNVIISANAIPEPAALALIAPAALVISRRRRQA